MEAKLVISATSQGFDKVKTDLADVAENIKDVSSAQEQVASKATEIANANSQLATSYREVNEALGAVSQSMAGMGDTLGASSLASFNDDASAYVQSIQEMTDAQNSLREGQSALNDAFSSTNLSGFSDDMRSGASASEELADNLKTTSSAATDLSDSLSGGMFSDFSSDVRDGASALQTVTENLATAGTATGDFSDDLSRATQHADDFSDNLDQVATAADNLAPSLRSSTAEIVQFLLAVQDAGSATAAAASGVSEARGGFDEYSIGTGSARSQTMLFRDALYLIRPAAYEAGASMQGFGMLLMAARGGLVILAAAIEGAFLVALEKASEKVTNLKEQLAGLTGANAARAFDDIRAGAESAHAPITAIGDAVMTVQRALLEVSSGPSLFGVGFADMEKNAATVDTVTTAITAMTKAMELNNITASTAAKSVNSYMEEIFKFDKATGTFTGLTLETFEKILKESDRAAEAIAMGFGKSISQLFQQLREGPIAAEATINALAKMAGEVDRLSATHIPTLLQATDHLYTAWIGLLDKMSEVGPIANFSKMIDGLAAALEKMATTNARQVIDDIEGIIAVIGILGGTAVIGKLVSAVGGLTAAYGGLAIGLTLLNGPIDYFMEQFGAAPETIKLVDEALKGLEVVLVGMVNPWAGLALAVYNFSSQLPDLIGWLERGVNTFRSIAEAIGSAYNALSNYFNLQNSGGGGGATQQAYYQEPSATETAYYYEEPSYQTAYYDTGEYGYGGEEYYYGEAATGGTFRVGDTEPVRFRATPGESVSIIPSDPSQPGSLFVVGGVGGTDSQLVSFDATKGDLVTITPSGLARPGGMSGAKASALMVVPSTGAPMQLTGRQITIDESYGRFATGGSFTVEGTGEQTVTFYGTPGETITISPADPSKASTIFKLGGTGGVDSEEVSFTATGGDTITITPAGLDPVGGDHATSPQTIGSGETAVGGYKVTVKDLAWAFRTQEQILAALLALSKAPGATAPATTPGAPATTPAAAAAPVLSATGTYTIGADFARLSGQTGFRILPSEDEKRQRQQQQQQQQQQQRATEQAARPTAAPTAGGGAAPKTTDISKQPTSPVAIGGAMKDTGVKLPTGPGEGAATWSKADWMAAGGALIGAGLLGFLGYRTGGIPGAIAGGVAGFFGGLEAGNWLASLFGFTKGAGAAELGGAESATWWDSTVSYLGDLWDSTVSTLTDTWDAASAGFGTLWETSTDALATFGNYLWDSASDAASYLWDTASSVIGSVVDMFTTPAAAEETYTAYDYGGYDYGYPYGYDYASEDFNYGYGQDYGYSPYTYGYGDYYYDYGAYYGDYDYYGEYARGGSFVVGGTGGTDSQLVGFAATPGERVSISPSEFESPITSDGPVAVALEAGQYATVTDVSATPVADVNATVIGEDPNTDQNLVRLLDEVGGKTTNLSLKNMIEKLKQGIVGGLVSTVGGTRMTVEQAMANMVKSTADLNVRIADIIAKQQAAAAAAATPKAETPRATSPASTATTPAAASAGGALSGGGARQQQPPPQRQQATQPPPQPRPSPKPTKPEEQPQRQGPTEAQRIAMAGWPLEKWIGPSQTPAGIAALEAQTMAAYFGTSGGGGPSLASIVGGAAALGAGFLGTGGLIGGLISPISAEAASWIGLAGGAAPISLGGRILGGLAGLATGAITGLSVADIVSQVQAGTLDPVGAAAGAMVGGTLGLILDGWQGLVAGAASGAAIGGHLDTGARDSTDWFAMGSRILGGVIGGGLAIAAAPETGGASLTQLATGILGGAAIGGAIARGIESAWDWFWTPAKADELQAAAQTTPDASGWIQRSAIGGILDWVSGLFSGPTRQTAGWDSLTRNEQQLALDVGSVLDNFAGGAEPTSQGFLSWLGDLAGVTPAAAGQVTILRPKGAQDYMVPGPGTPLEPAMTTVSIIRGRAGGPTTQDYRVLGEAAGEIPTTTITVLRPGAPGTGMAETTLKVPQTTATQMASGGAWMFNEYSGKWEEIPITGYYNTMTGETTPYSTAGTAPIYGNVQLGPAPVTAFQTWPYEEAWGTQAAAYETYGGIGFYAEPLTTAETWISAPAYETYGGVGAYYGAPITDFYGTGPSTYYDYGYPTTTAETWVSAPAYETYGYDTGYYDYYNYGYDTGAVYGAGTGWYDYGSYGGGYDTGWYDYGGYEDYGYYASGGSFVVGGSGGTDSQAISFWATPGELISVTPPFGGDIATATKTESATGVAFGQAISGIASGFGQAISSMAQTFGKGGIIHEAIAAAQTEAFNPQRMVEVIGQALGGAKNEINVHVYGVQDAGGFFPAIAQIKREMRRQLG